MQRQIRPGISTHAQLMVMSTWTALAVDQSSGPEYWAKCMGCIYISHRLQLPALILNLARLMSGSHRRRRRQRRRHLKINKNIFCPCHRQQRRATCDVQRATLAAATKFSCSATRPMAVCLMMTNKCDFWTRCWAYACARWVPLDHYQRQTFEQAAYAPWARVMSPAIKCNLICPQYWLRSRSQN